MEKILRGKSTVHLDLTAFDKWQRWRNFVLPVAAGVVPVALGMPLGWGWEASLVASAAMSLSTFAVFRSLRRRSSKSRLFHSSFEL